MGIHIDTRTQLPLVIPDGADYPRHRKRGCQQVIGWTGEMVIGHLLKPEKKFFHTGNSSHCPDFVSEEGQELEVKMGMMRNRFVISKHQMSLAQLQEKVLFLISYITTSKRGCAEIYRTEGSAGLIQDIRIRTVLILPGRFLYRWHQQKPFGASRDRKANVDRYLIYFSQLRDRLRGMKTTIYTNNASGLTSQQLFREDTGEGTHIIVGEEQLDLMQLSHS